MKSPTKSARRGVPTFSLYGEQSRINDVEFVHIEDIASRSRHYNWEIDSHTHKGLFQMLCLLEGKARIRLDDLEVDVRSPAAILIPPAVVHAFQFAPESHGYVLTVAESLLAEELPEAQRILFENLLLQARLVELNSPQGDIASRLQAMLEQIMAEFRWPQLGRAAMLDWLVRGAMLLVARQLATTTINDDNGRGERGRAELFARFRQLVETHWQEHWTIPRYAEELKVTESRLNRLCRSLADKTAFEVVQDRLMLEARRRLVYVQVPVSQLAYELGYQDPAYFCRHFKKQTGMTPTDFRKQGRILPLAAATPP